MNQVERLIWQLSPKYGLDPRAVRAVAMSEGGTSWGSVGDAGTSYGPFQLHVGGALPSGRGAGWANSPAGLEYALRSMARSGARGLRGRAAIEAIVRNFERPADPTSEIERALAHYGKGVRPMPFAGQPETAMRLGPPSINKRALAMALINAPIGKPLDIMSLVGLISRTGSPAPASSRPTTAGGSEDVSWRPRAGGKRGGRWGVTPQLYDFAKRFNLQITSGFRSVAKQRAIYANRSAPGSVAAPGKSYHNSGRAIDVAVSAASKRAYEWALKHPGLFAEAFFDTRGVYIKNGRIVRGRIGGHSDHIHFALR